MLKKILKGALEILGDGKITTNKKRECIKYCEKQMYKSMFVSILLAFIMIVFKLLNIRFLSDVINLIVLILSFYVVAIKIPVLFLFLSGLRNAPVDDEEGSDNN